ncbi:ClpP/crotonase [Neoconidiobolus thromboides FSU 785]|nr:ClpP/crotonase [Neoconidiobolus thromboides FSU 785]
MDYQFETLKVQLLPDTQGVLLVQLNRPKKLNAFNNTLINEYRECFKKIEKDNHVRCVIVTSSGKHFTAGIDVSVFSSMGESDLDVARKALNQRQVVLNIQDSVSQVEYCSKPVIMGVSGFCLGMGIDIITCGDIRFCTSDAKFSVKEIDLGLAADVGTLQRLPKVCGNQSWVNEICLTARNFDAKEALQFGLVSNIYQNQEELMNAALKIATAIASKSPVAVLGTKHLLLHSRDHSVAEGLLYTATWNASMLQTEDIPKSVMASMQKKPAFYSNL